MRTAIAFVGLIVGVVGCSSGSDPGAAPESVPASTAEQPTTTTTAEPTTTTTVDPAVARQQAYFYAVTPFNEVSDQARTITEGIDERGSIAAAANALREACALLAPASEAFAVALSEYPDWGDAADEVSTLISLSAADAGLLYECAARSDDMGVITFMADSVGPAFERSSSAASAVRLAIGLPISRDPTAERPGT